MSANDTSRINIVLDRIDVTPKVLDGIRGRVADRLPHADVPYGVAHLAPETT
jgi:hypothetical protein